MSIKIGASAPKGAKGRRTSPPGIMPSLPAKKIEGGQSLGYTYIYIRSVFTPYPLLLIPSFPRRKAYMVHMKHPQDPQRFQAFLF